MIRIKEIRQKRGITQAQLADALNVCQSTVAMWENGENKPRTDKLPELAKILGCEVSDLFKKEV